MFAANRDAFFNGLSTPRDMLEEYLARIEERENDVRAFAALDIEGARAAADAATRRYRDGCPLSPIDGMPVGIKDVFDTRDLPTTMGSPFHVGRRAEHDAAHVRALRSAGAYVLGKTVTSQFAIVGAGPTRNPHDLARSPGATSAGSAAAVASGMVPVATGSQARGSIIRPASYCGIWGMKPSYGALNRAGLLTPNKSYDHVGMLAASSEDMWLALWEIAERAGGDPGHPGLTGPAEPPRGRQAARVALLETAGWNEAGEAAKQALLGFVQRLRDADVTVTTRAEDAELDHYETMVSDVPSRWLTISQYESLWPMQSYRERDPSLLAPPILRGIEAGERITRAAYAAALDWREMLRAVHARLGERFDFLLTLAAPDVAPAFPEPGSSSFNELASLIGVPAISVPLLSISGMPLGVQLIGFARQDYRLLEFAMGLQPPQLPPGT